MTRAEAVAYRQAIEYAATHLTDEEALASPALFPLWAVGKEYQADDRVQDENVLYRCVQAHTAQEDWRPADTPALWALVSVEEWPEWIQPQGAHDAYPVGAKVSHNEKHWISLMDANIYEPGVYGWEEVE